MIVTRNGDRRTRQRSEVSRNPWKKIILNEVTKAQNNKSHMDPASNLVYNLKHR